MMLTALLYGCQKNELENPDEGLRTIVANISSSETKTHIGEYSDGVYKTLWSEGDEIAVFPKGYNDKNVFTLSSGAGTSKGTFVGECDFKEGVAYYPADKCDSQFDSWNSRFEVEFPTRQKYVKDSFEDGLYPMIAKGENGKLTFTNILSIVRLNITGTRRVDSLVFSAGGGRWCSGRFKVSTLGAILPVSETNPDYVTIDCGDGVYLQEDTPTAFYFVLPPWTYSEFNIKIYTPDGVMEKKSSNALVLKPSEIRSVPAFRFQLKGDPDYEEDIVEVLDGSIYPTCLGGNFDVSVRKNVPYILEIYADWISQVETKETEIETLTFYVEPNLSPNTRVGSVYLYYGGEQEVFSILQDGYSDPYVEIIEEQLVFSGEEDGCEAEVTGNRSGISVCADADWIRAAFTDSTETFHPYRMTKVLSISAERNETHSARNANVIVSIGDVKDTLAVSQSFAPHGDLEIHIPEAGTLPDIIEGEDILMYTKVIITGEMNYDDVNYFQSYASNVEILDLAGVSFEDNLLRGFNEMHALKEVFLPPTLIQIGGEGGKDSWAFHECTSLEKVDWGINPQLEVIGTGIYSRDNGLSIVTSFRGPFSYCSSLKTIDIPAKVTTILPGAFYQSGIEEIRFADNAVIDTFSPYSYVSGSWLGNAMSSTAGMFYGCDNLSTIEIPESVIMIENGAFIGWTGLKNLSIPETVKYIGTNKLFSGCSSLEKVSLPTSVSSVGKEMFLGCTCLNEVEFRGGCTSIGNDAFQGCINLEKFDFSMVEEFIGGCFANTGFKEVKFPDRMTEVPGSMFYGCDSLTKIDLNNVERIGIGAFANCSALKEVVLPKSVSRVEQSAFDYCDNLEVVRILSADIQLVDCFSQCNSLKNIYIGKDVVSASSTGLDLHADFDGFIFENGCIIEEFGLCCEMEHLTSIDLPPSVKRLSPNAFRGCVNLIEIDDMLEGIEEIGTGAFTNSGVKNIKIPEGVKRIGPLAFSKCYELMTMSLPSSLEYLGYGVFRTCPKLISHTINGAHLVLEGDVSDSGTFDGCQFVTKLTIGNDVQSISSVDNGTLLSSNISEIEFEEDSQVKLLTGAIFYRDYLGTDTLVETIELPDSIEELGEKVFYHSSISEIKLSKNIKSIGKMAFDSSAITSVYFKSDVPPQLGKDVFGHAGSSKPDIFVPLASVEAYKAAWPRYADRIFGYDY